MTNTPTPAAEAAEAQVTAPSRTTFGVCQCRNCNAAAAAYAEKAFRQYAEKTISLLEDAASRLRRDVEGYATLDPRSFQEAPVTDAVQRAIQTIVMNADVSLLARKEAAHRQYNMPTPK